MFDSLLSAWRWHTHGRDRPAPPRARVAIVGAGFAGLSAARALRHVAADVTLIDQHNYHLFTPLTYQVASAMLDPAEVAHPVRAIVRDQRNVRFRLGHVRGVDLARRTVDLDDGRIEYDYLVLAAGSVTDFFGNASVARNAFPLKDLADALELRRQVLGQFERATWTRDPAARRALLTFAVAGAGPTGVEYAGALAELVRLALSRDYPEVNPREVTIVLLDGADRVLGTFAPGLSTTAARELRRLGVRLELGTLVSRVESGRVRLADGRALAAATVVWAAGVRAAPLAHALEADRGHGDRLRVLPTLQLPKHPEVFVVGDMAEVVGPRGVLPMLSPVAIQEGRQAGRNVEALIAGRSPRPFRYVDRGTMATIGRSAAVAEIGPLRLRGRLAWWLWLSVHIALLIGFRDRVVVLLNWAWAYVFYDRPIRLMTDTPRALRPRPAGAPREARPADARVAHLAPEPPSVRHTPRSTRSHHTTQPPLQKPTRARGSGRRLAATPVQLSRLPRRRRSLTRPHPLSRRSS